MNSLKKMTKMRAKLEKDTGITYIHITGGKRIVNSIEDRIR